MGTLPLSPTATPSPATGRQGGAPPNAPAKPRNRGLPRANNQHRVNPAPAAALPSPRQDASLSQTRLFAGPMPRPRRDQQYTQISMISAARPLPGFLPRRNRTAQRKNGAAAGQTLFPFFGRGKTAATTAFFLEAYLCQTQVRGRSTAGLVGSLLTRVPCAAAHSHVTRRPPERDIRHPSPSSPETAPSRTACRPRRSQGQHHRTNTSVPSQTCIRTKRETQAGQPRLTCRSRKAFTALLGCCRSTARSAPTRPGRSRSQA